jgi:F0F1-type ATP synthase epsilon subunit
MSDVAETKDEQATEKQVDEQNKAAQQLENRATKEGDQVSMHVKVASPFTTYFDGQAFSLSGENATGPFDILPMHHNFMSLLQPCTIVIRTATSEEEKIEIGGGLLHVKADKVIVFLDV